MKPDLNLNMGTMDMGNLRRFVNYMYLLHIAHHCASLFIIVRNIMMFLVYSSISLNQFC